MNSTIMQLELFQLKCNSIEQLRFFYLIHSNRNIRKDIFSAKFFSLNIIIDFHLYIHQFTAVSSALSAQLTKMCFQHRNRD